MAHGSRSSAQQQCSTRPNSWDFPYADGNRDMYPLFMVYKKQQILAVFCRLFVCLIMGLDSLAFGSRSSAQQQCSTHPHSWDFPDADGDRDMYP